MTAIVDEKAIHSVSLPTVLEIGELENTLERLYLENKHSFDRLELNLEKCYFIEVTSLVYLIAFISRRARNGQDTILGLPKDKHVRDFLRAWNFQEAVKQAVGRPFFTLVRPKDHKYFGENKTYNEMKYAGTVKSGGLERLLSEKFFSIRTFPIELTQSKTMIVMNESSRWEERLISSVLERHLSGPKGYVASRVIYESLTNAVRHPNATLIQTASYFDSKIKINVPEQKNKDSAEKKPQTSPGLLTIVVWDDGDSMVDTLKAAIDRGKPIRSKFQPSNYDGFWVKLEDENHKTINRRISSDFTPDRNTVFELVLLSTIFPGITRDPFAKDHIVHKDLHDKPELMLPGMGLSVLVNAAVDIFGGSVAFRTNRYLMNVKAASKTIQKQNEAKYKVKIYRYSEAMPPFLGNMVTVRLPIKN